jgi:hypothetical protein
MYNTYGIRSIDNQTFNRSYNSDSLSYSYPQRTRNTVITLLKAHNLSLNILGYIPGISTLSGSFRILTGSALCLATLAIGDRNAKKGPIIGHWYDEALSTAAAQVARGALEGFVPFGKAINLGLDAGASVLNVFGEMMLRTDSDPNWKNPWPHPDPNYPLPLRVLDLA